MRVTIRVPSAIKVTVRELSAHESDSSCTVKVPDPGGTGVPAHSKLPPNLIFILIFLINSVDLMQGYSDSLVSSLSVLKIIELSGASPLDLYHGPVPGPADPFVACTLLALKICPHANIPSGSRIDRSCE